jgi:tetratricopeptide (TPR) repeat protein
LEAKFLGNGLFSTARTVLSRIGGYLASLFKSSLPADRSTEIEDISTGEKIEISKEIPEPVSTPAEEVVESSVDPITEIDGLSDTALEEGAVDPVPQDVVEREEPAVTPLEDISDTDLVAEIEESVSAPDIEEVTEPEIEIEADEDESNLPGEAEESLAEEAAEGDTDDEADDEDADEEDDDEEALEEGDEAYIPDVEEEEQEVFEPIVFAETPESLSGETFREFSANEMGLLEEGEKESLLKGLNKLRPALTMALAYMREESIGANDYLELLKKSGEEIDIRLDGKPVDKNAKLLYAAFCVSFGKLSEKIGKASNLLSVASFFHNEKIPLDLIKSHLKYAPEPIQTAEVDIFGAPNIIGKYFDVKLEDGYFTVDQLVQELSRFKLKYSARRKWAQAVADIVSAGFPEKSYEPDIWPDVSLLLPHAFESSRHARRYSVAVESTIKLLNLSGLYLKSAGRYKEAVEALNISVSTAESYFGKEHAELALLLNNRGMALREVCEYGSAMKDLQRAIDINSDALEPDNPSHVADMNNIGLVFLDTGDFKEASRYFAEALGLAEKVFGKNHPQVSACCGNLAVAFYRLGEKEKAAKELERALLIDREIRGPGHVSVAVRLSNLASLKMESGDTEAALLDITEALRIDEAAFGGGHPRVAEDLGKIATIQKLMGELDESKKSFRRALQAGEAVFGMDHPAYAVIKNNFGKLLHAKGDRNKALKNCMEALAVFKKRFGAKHFMTVSAGANVKSLDAKRAGKK